MANLTGLIERLVDIEATLGIQLNGLSAETDEDGDLTVLGEVLFSTPPIEDNPAQVIALLYDEQGRVIEKDYSYVGSEGIAFDSFKISVYGINTQIKKIRVYVKRA
jgi:hypothetical protein